MNRRRVEPGPGQETVWDYPRPPRLEVATRRVRIVFGGETIVDTRRAKRVLETSHPPVYYVPLEDVRTGALERTDRSSFCEWKGRAGYYTVRAGGREARDAAGAGVAVERRQLGQAPGRVVGTGRVKDRVAERHPGRDGQVHGGHVHRALGGRNSA
jgi:uncharacterized protein (DUF427 family)